MCQPLIERIRKSQDAKALIENFLSLGVLQSVNLILPIIVLPYLLCIYGKEGYGQVIFVASLVNYFSALTDYSFKITGTRNVAKHRHSTPSLSYIYSEVTIVRGILCIVSLMIISLIVLIVPSFREYWYLYALTAPVLVGYVLFPDWFFQGIEKMKFITYLNVGIKLFFTISVFVFVKKKGDLWIYPLLNTLGYLLAGVAGQLLLLQKYNVRYYRMGRRRIKQSLKGNFPIFVTQFIPNLYNNTSTFLLGIFTTTALVGIYDAARKIVDVLAMVISVLERVLFPFVVRKPQQFHKIASTLLITGLLLSLLPIIFFPVISRFLGISSPDFFFLIVILSIGVFFYSCYVAYGTCYLIAQGCDRIVMNLSIITSVTGFVLSFPLIEVLGILGAAITVTLSRGMLGGGGYLLAKKRRKGVENAL